MNIPLFGQNIGDIDHIYLNYNRFKNKIDKFASIANEKIMLPTQMTIPLHNYTNVKSDISKIKIKQKKKIHPYINSCESIVID